MNLNGDVIFLFAAYASFLGMAIIFSLLTNSLLLKFSKTLGDRSEQHRQVVRWSSKVKPSVGGFSFYMLFLISFSTYGIFNLPGNEYFNEQLVGIIFAVTLGFLIGLADDAYNTYPWLKFFGQLLCGIFLVATNTLIHATGIFILDVLLTLTWVVGIMNSINILDNMDGISGTVSLGILFCCLLAILVEKNSGSFDFLLFLGVSGAIIGFLAFNWHPASIYMGDTGSQFLGAFIAAVTVHLVWNYRDSAGPAIQFRQYIIPLIAFSVPIIDTSTVVFRRLAKFRKVAYVISAIVFALGIASFFNGFELGVEFKGGRSYTVEFPAAVKNDDVRDDLEKVFGDFPVIKSVGDNKHLNITTSYKIEEDGADSLVQTKLYEGLKKVLPANITYDQFVKKHLQDRQTVQPSISEDLKRGAFKATIFALIIIFLYIFIRFKDWRYSIGTIFTLLHDVLSLTAAFSALIYCTIPRSVVP